jgi:hypothetical protein
MPLSRGKGRYNKSNDAIKNLGRARPYNPAGPPCYLLSAMVAADGPTNRDDAAISNPGRGRKNRYGVRSVDGDATGSP